jgi:hypothetical protein
MYGYWRNVGRLVFVIGMVHRYVIQCKKKTKTKTKKSCISHSLPSPLFFHLTVFWFDFSSHVTRSVFLFKKAPKNLTKKKLKKFYLFLILVSNFSFNFYLCLFFHFFSVFLNWFVVSFSLTPPPFSPFFIRHFTYNRERFFFKALKLHPPPCLIVYRI